MTQTTTVTFKDLMRMTAGNSQDAVPVSSEMVAYHKDAQQWTLTLPLHGLLQQHYIDTSALQNARPVVADLDWVTRGAPLLDYLRIIEVASTRGKVPVGTALPNAIMGSERGTMLGWHVDPGFADLEYELRHVVEVRTEVSGELELQSELDMVEAIEVAHMLATRETLQQQVLNGQGGIHELDAVTGATGISSEQFALADRGSWELFSNGEDSIEDAKGIPGPWFVGTELSSSARSKQIDNSGARRVEEVGRITLSGTRIYRTPDLPSTTGVVADWTRGVTLLLLNRVLWTVDRISLPGTVRLTSRVPCALVVTRPELVHAVTQQ